jgi:hypothetical protein
MIKRTNFCFLKALKTANQYLPIKQKPLLLVQKQKTVFKMLINQEEQHQQTDTKTEKELISSAQSQDTNHIIQINSNQQNNSHGIRDFFRKKRIKHERKSGDFSSSVNILQHSNTKQKKTKICCLL